MNGRVIRRIGMVVDLQLAKALVEYETLNLEEVKQVLEGKALDRPALTQGESLVGEQERKGPVGDIVEGI